MSLAACDVSTPSIRPLPPLDPTASPTTLATDDHRFRAMSYPGGDPAPCGQQAAPDSDHAAYRGNLKRISTPDPNTVVFELCTADVAFRSKIASPAFGIDDAGWLANHLDPTLSGVQAISRQVNGTGPYQLERWTAGQEISLARNDRYQGPTPGAERVIVRWGADPLERAAALQAGSVDGVDRIDPVALSDLTADVSVALLPRAGLNVLYLGFGGGGGPLAREPVRRAIALGLDRRRIVETLLPPGSTVAAQVTPCEMPHGCAGDGWYDYDPTLARETLAAAGYPDGFATTLHVATDGSTGAGSDAVAAEIRTELADNLGITVELVAEPDMATALAADGLSLAKRDAGVPDISLFLDDRFSGGANDIDKALATGAATADDDKREAAYASANDAIRSHVPVVPIAHVGSMAAYQADVDGAVTSPLDLEPLAALVPGDRRQFVWLTSDEPSGLYCPIETDRAALLICSQLVERLYAYEPGSATPVPSLATACAPNKGLTTWTCTLREGVTFHDGSRLEADDVVVSFAAQWDAEHPLHLPGVDAYPAFADAFGGFLHPPATGG